MTEFLARQMLRRAALTAALLLGTAPAALADAPGYDFLPFAPPAAQAPMPSPQRGAPSDVAQPCR